MLLTPDVSLIERDERHAGLLEHRKRPLRNQSSPRRRSPSPNTRQYTPNDRSPFSRPPRWGDHHRDEAIKTRKWYCRCGKIGHIKKNCTSATKKRAQRQTMTGTNNYAINETSSILAFYRLNFLNLVTTFYRQFFRKRTNKKQILILSCIYLRFIFF